MKLLIVTQAVDAEDPVLGFFVRWIQVLAERVERIEVICLKKGAYTLPANVRVHSLGKESGVKSRFVYIRRFFVLLYELRHVYDTVFVHMNEEYVLLGGICWKALRKRVVFWRNHKMGSWRTRLAVFVSTAVCHTSPEAFVAYSTKAMLMPIGIDTDAFSPSQEIPRPNSVLFLGRVDPVKRVDVFLRAVDMVTVPIKVSMYGNPSDPDSTYSKEVNTLAEPLIQKKVLSKYDAVSHSLVPNIYRSHAVYVNLTPSGSFDKTIGEALSCGALVVCANNALAGILPHSFLVTENSPEAVAGSIEAAVSLTGVERAQLSEKLRQYIQENHSLSSLVKQLLPVLVS